MKTVLRENVCEGTFGITTLNDTVKFILNKKLLCKAVLEAGNGKLFRKGLMPLVYKKYKANVVKLASGIVSSFPQTKATPGCPAILNQPFKSQKSSSFD